MTAGGDADIYGFIYCVFMIYYVIKLGYQLILDEFYI